MCVCLCVSCECFWDVSLAAVQKVGEVPCSPERATQTTDCECSIECVHTYTSIRFVCVCVCLQEGHADMENVSNAVTSYTGISVRSTHTTLLTKDYTKLYTLCVCVCVCVRCC